MPALINKYGGQKLGNFINDFASDLNPVRLQKGATNLSETASSKMETGKKISSSFVAANQLRKKQKQTPGTGMSLKEYFQGKQKGVELPSIDNFRANKAKSVTFNSFVSDGKDATRATVRTIGAGAVAAYGVSPMVLGEDNFVNRSIEAGAAFGAHAAIISSTINEGAKAGGNKAAGMFGVAYGGLAAINAIRSGNNLGPF